MVRFVYYVVLCGYVNVNDILCYVICYNLKLCSLIHRSNVLLSTKGHGDPLLGASPARYVTVHIGF